MALPTLQRKLFENDGYGPNIKDERLSTDITVKDWDASHDYPANVLAKAGGDIYRSVAASGPGTSAGAVNPTQDASAVYWEVFGKGGSVPVGTVIWLSTSTVPVGFLLCNGQAVGRAAYPDLFGAIGTTYGAGDGSTTFNLPNLIDKFIEGASTNIGDSVAAGLPNIIGQISMRGSENTGNYGGVFVGNGDSSSAVHSIYHETSGTFSAVKTGASVKADSFYFDASRNNSIYGNSSTVQPPAVKLLPCIKAYSDVDNLGSLDVAQLENYVQNNCVHLTGDESISGFKNFLYDITKFSQVIISSNEGDSNILIPPSGTTNTYLTFRDVNSVEMSALQNHLTPNSNTIKIMCRKIGDSSTALSGLAYACLEAYYPSGVYSFHPGSAEVLLGNTGDRRWKQLYATTTTISTSDERAKTSIDSFPDEILDAWGSVNFVQFQFNNAVEEKGENARLHSGLIAQRIDEAFKARGLDASRYALFCYDEWEAEPEERDEQGNVVSPAKPAGNEYSLRYEEALCMEAAYQRRRAGRAEARIASLEARFAALEAKLNG